MASDEQIDTQTLGIHHVTAIAGDPQKNLNFYSGLLGLRLVKLTINFDDPLHTTSIMATARAIQVQSSPSFHGRERSMGDRAPARHLRWPLPFAPLRSATGSSGWCGTA